MPTTYEGRVEALKVRRIVYTPKGQLYTVVGRQPLYSSIPLPSPYIHNIITVLFYILFSKSARLSTGTST